MQIRSFALIVVLLSVVHAIRGDLPKENVAATNSTNSENALSASSIKEYWEHVSGYGHWTEDPAPSPNPPVNDQAAHIAEMAVPLVQLAYTWRPDDYSKEDEQKQMKAAQKVISGFPDQPGVLLDTDSNVDHRAYVSKGSIPDFAKTGNTRRKAVIIGFPGTEFYSTEDITRDVQSATATEWTGKQSGGTQWKVAKGFLKRYNEHLTENGFEQKMLDYVKKEKPDYIYIVGHSLGGAVAAICGADLATRPDFKDKKIVVITFGQPRAFNYETATEVNKLFKQGNQNGNEYWRIVQYGDQIPDLPYTMLGFEHVGRPFYLNKKTWTTNRWEFQEQAQDFSPQKWPQNIATHCCDENGKQWCYGTTHFMEVYKCRLDELHKQIDADNTLAVRVAAAVNNILARLDHQILAFGGVFVLVAFLFFLRARKQAQEDSVYIALMNTTEQEI